MWALTAPSRQYTEAKHGTFLLNLHSAHLDTSAPLGLHGGLPTRCALSWPRRSGGPWPYFPPLLPACHLRPLLALWSPNTLNFMCFMHLLLLFYIGFSALRSFRGCFLPINFLSVLKRPSLKGSWDSLLWCSSLPTCLPTKAPCSVCLKAVGLKWLRSVICSCLYFWLLDGTQWEQVPHQHIWGHITRIR